MPLTLKQLQETGVYFHITHGVYTPNYDHYLTQCLAEGLKSLGVPSYANREAGCFVPYTKDKPLPQLWLWDVGDGFSNRKEFLDSVRTSPAREKFILCRADASGTFLTPPGVPGLMTHENRFRRVEGVRLPWAHGLSERILAETENNPPFDLRKPTILRNFRPSNNQHVRNIMDWAFVPHLEKHFKIERAISNDHFEKLRTSIGCLAYGGTWEEDLLPSSVFSGNPTYRSYRDFIHLEEPLAIIRWDSWRWFESLSAGCLTFQLDLEKYGLLMPVMPTPWEHYIPIDLADPKGTFERFMAEKPRWEEIAANGRKWVRTHYTPRAVAARLVDYVSPVETPEAPGEPADLVLAGVG